MKTKHWILCMLLMITAVNCGGKQPPELLETEAAMPSQPSPTLATESMVPTILPSWVTYTNEALGYRIDHPAEATITELGFSGMDSNEIPPGEMSFQDYFHYVELVLPDGLCVSVEIPGVMITVGAPAPLNSYSGPCPGMGIGTGYRWEHESKTFLIEGEEMQIDGTQLYLESTGAFESEFYFTDLENGFRVSITGMIEEGMTEESYQQQWETGVDMLATLHWTGTPELIRPGTSCAGTFTLLMPGVTAVVTGMDMVEVLREADLTSERIGELSAGTVVRVREGPVCTDEVVLWRVEGATIPGGSGWVAEGDWMTRWLERIRED